jgi:hypothetical protein
MSKSKLYAIVDRDNGVLGSWAGKTYFVNLFESQKEAKEFAIEVNLTDYQIAIAEYAINLKPSNFLKIHELR